MKSHKADDKLPFSRWLINLSDEVDSPLNLMGATLEHLYEDESDSLRKDQLKLALDQCSKFQNLMRNLHLAALEDNRMAVLQLSHALPVSITDDILKSFSPVAKNRGVDLKFEQPQQFETILDVERYSRIMSTLISNAIQFCKKEGGVVNLNLSSDKEKKCWQVSVQDNGIGIVPEKLAHVFDPLYDKDPIHLRLYQTTSMGLYLTSLFVKSLGGEISVESEKHLYTRFRISFPLISEQQISYSNYTMIQGKANTVVPRMELKVAGMNDMHEEKQHSYHLNTVVLLSPKKKLRKAFAEYWKDAAVYQLTSVSKAFTHSLQLLPDLIVIKDKVYEGQHARDLIRQLKSNKVTRLKPLVWLSSKEKQPMADLNLPADTHPQELLEEIHYLLLRRKQLMGEVLPAAGGEPRYQNSREAFLTQLERIVDANLKQSGFGMDKLAELLHLDRSQIHRKVKAYTGVSTTEYVRNYKLKLAYKELKEGNGSIAEIAFRCGFNSTSYFARSFKQLYNLSPIQVLSQHN